LILRSQNPNDRRNIPLALSDEGQRVMDSIFNETEVWLLARFEFLNPEEQEILLQGMETLRRVFSNS
jgi:DNA-binding MarR family transcriptional regulator